MHCATSRQIPSAANGGVSSRWGNMATGQPPLGHIPETSGSAVVHGPSENNTLHTGHTDLQHGQTAAGDAAEAVAAAVAAISPAAATLAAGGQPDGGPAAAAPPAMADAAAPADAAAVDAAALPDDPAKLKEQLQKSQKQLADMSARLDYAVREISVQNSIIEEQQQVIHRLNLLGDQVAQTLSQSTTGIYQEWQGRVQALRGGTALVELTQLQIQPVSLGQMPGEQGLLPMVVMPASSLPQGALMHLPSGEASAAAAAAAGGDGPGAGISGEEGRRPTRQRSLRGQSSGDSLGLGGAAAAAAGQGEGMSQLPLRKRGSNALGNLTSLPPAAPRHPGGDDRHPGAEALHNLANVAYVAHNLASKPGSAHGLLPASLQGHGSGIPGQMLAAPTGSLGLSMDPAAAGAAAGGMPAASGAHPGPLCGAESLGDGGSSEPASKRQRTGKDSLPGSPGKGTRGGPRQQGLGGTPTREVVPGQQQGVLELAGVTGMSPFQMHARPLPQGLSVQGSDLGAPVQQHMAAQHGNGMVAALATALTVDHLTGTQMIHLTNGQAALHSAGSSLGMSLDQARRGAMKVHGDEDGINKRGSRISGGRSLENELDKQIPEEIQQRLREYWQEHGAVRVVCEQLLGTFTVESGSLIIRADGSNVPVHPRAFEVEAGRVSSKNWKISIRLLDFTVNGKPGAPLVKLGHFMIVNGLKDLPANALPKQDSHLGH